MDLCNTCRFWIRSKYDLHVGDCTLTEWDDSEGFLHPESKSKVMVGGHEPGSGVLETSGDFGCTQWEPKETGTRDL